MSEKFTIKEILDYPDKIYNSLSDINLEGTLTVVMKSKQMKRKKDNQIFFAQFLVIKDDTGEIGINIAVGEEKLLFEELAKGKQVKVEGATTSTYKDKNGKIQRVLKGKVSLLETGTKESISNVPRGYSQMPEGGHQYVVSQEVWEKRNRILTRIAIVKSLIESKREYSADLVDEADAWFDWVCWSGDKEPNSEKKEIKSERKDKKKTNKSPIETVINENFDRKKMETELLKSYTEACKLKLFDTNYDLSKWMFEQFKKKTVGSLADDQIVDAVRVMNEMIKIKEK